MSGDEKAEWCASFARERSLNLAACWGYADSYYDLPFLAGVGHPVAVNPDRRLAATARARQWLVVRFVKERSNSAMIPETAGKAVAGWTRGLHGAS
jgi:phosphoserine phosphatase